ncbi:MAG TPA: hypothetical protein VG123_13495, partial [Streptosporangiaceae bacterium]|nr:hypothetical protein [Streptosporangiaceae bacterium]
MSFDRRVVREAAQLGRVTWIPGPLIRVRVVDVPGQTGHQRRGQGLPHRRLGGEGVQEVPAVLG